MASNVDIAFLVLENAVSKMLGQIFAFTLFTVVTGMFLFVAGRLWSIRGEKDRDPLDYPIQLLGTMGTTYPLRMSILRAFRRWLWTKVIDISVKQLVRKALCSPDEERRYRALLELGEIKIGRRSIESIQGLSSDPRTPQRVAYAAKRALKKARSPKVEEETILSTRN